MSDIISVQIPVKELDTNLTKSELKDTVESMATSEGHVHTIDLTHCKTGEELLRELTKLTGSVEKALAILRSYTLESTYG